MILLPKKEIHLSAASCVGMKGFIRMKCWHPERGGPDNPRIDTGWFPNTILTNGRNNMTAYSDWLTYCHVGTGSSLPVPGNTQLDTFVVSTNSIPANSTSTQGAAPYYGYRRRTYRFAQGAGHGGENLSEAGIGWGASGSVLVSRALIVDPDTQLPTTVTPLSDEILDVSYELRYYPPLSDVANSVVLNGVTYDTITRASLVTSAVWSSYIGTAIGERSPSAATWRAYDGTLGTLEQQPNNNSADHDTGVVNNIAYANNSYTRNMSIATGPTGWNLAAGIRSIYWETTAGAYQTQFSSNPGGLTIPKDATYTMTLEVKVVWAGLDIFSNWNMIAASDSTTPASGEWNTNLAGTLLRISWLDNTATNHKPNLPSVNGAVFRILDALDQSKWIEYTVTGGYVEQASWTEYVVSQTNISNGGPVTGNASLVKELNR